MADATTNPKSKQLRVTAEALAALLIEGNTFISHDGRDIIVMERGFPLDAKVTKVEPEAGNLTIILTVESDLFIDGAPMDVKMERRDISNFTMPCNGVEKES